MLATHVPSMPTESGQRLQYVGILLCYVEAINPTDSEKIQMGLINQEMLDSGRVKPVNYKEEDGRYRIDFWLKGKSEEEKDIRVRHSIFIKNEDAKPSSAGNIQVINHQGKSAYIPDALFQKGQTPYPDWFSAPYQKARIGEAELVSFVNAWTNKKMDDKAVALDFVPFTKGMIKTLHTIMNSDKSNYIKVMLGVRIADDGRRFQSVFGRVIMPAWTNNYERLHKELTNYIYNSQSRNEFGISPDEAYDRKLYRLRVWEPQTERALTSQDVVKEEYRTESSTPTLDLPISSMHDEDLPF